jgi:hypothetical protein
LVIDSEILAADAGAEAEDDKILPELKTMVLPKLKTEFTRVRPPRSCVLWLHLW